MAQYLNLIEAGFSILTQFLCHVTLKLAVSRSRPSVPYGADFFYIQSAYLHIKNTFLTMDRTGPDPPRSIKSENPVTRPDATGG